MNASEKRIAAVFKAFCDENRIRILKALATGEKCACELLKEIQASQPTLSHHMKILCDAEIAIPRKDGKRTYYSLDPRGTERAKNLLDEITAPRRETENN